MKINNDKTKGDIKVLSNIFYYQRERLTLFTPKNQFYQPLRNSEFSLQNTQNAQLIFKKKKFDGEKRKDSTEKPTY